MRILVTGATGFIGGRTAERLLQRGDEVVVLARRPARAAALAALGAEVVEGDLLDAASLERATAGCEAVIHAAGVPRPAPRRVLFRVHVDGTRLLVEAARRAGARRVVHLASQSVVFAGNDLVDVDESLPYPTRFIDLYSETKARGEQAALAADGPDLEVTSLRPSVVWGRGDTTILPVMARLARGPLGIPAAGDGSNLESCCHVENLTAAILAALTAPAAPGRAYFLFDDVRPGWRELLARQLEAAGIKARFRRVPRAMGPLARGLDRTAELLGLTVPLAAFGFRMAVTSRSYRTDRAREELGWRPRMGFEEGLADLAAWVRELGGPDALVSLAGGRDGNRR